MQANEEPVSSPLSSPALLGTGKEEEQKIIPKREKVQAVLKAIKQVCCCLVFITIPFSDDLIHLVYASSSILFYKCAHPCVFQSPKKVNLVAALVRGMRVEDALMQLQVTVKRASQTVYRVIS